MAPQLKSNCAVAWLAWADRSLPPCCCCLGVQVAAYGRTPVVLHTQHAVPQSCMARHGRRVALSHAAALWCMQEGQPRAECYTVSACVCVHAAPY